MARPSIEQDLEDPSLLYWIWIGFGIGIELGLFALPLTLIGAAVVGILSALLQPHLSSPLWGIES